MFGITEQVQQFVSSTFNRNRKKDNLFSKSDIPNAALSMLIKKLFQLGHRAFYDNTIELIQQWIDTKPYTSDNRDKCLIVIHYLVALVKCRYVVFARNKLEEQKALDEFVIKTVFQYFTESSQEIF